MKRFLLLLALVCLEKNLYAQTPRTPYIYSIKADSVKITNTCDTAELIIENHTQTVPGFLFNKGGGRTEFRRVMQAINYGEMHPYAPLDLHDMYEAREKNHDGEWSTVIERGEMYFYNNNFDRFVLQF